MYIYIFFFLSHFFISYLVFQFVNRQFIPETTYSSTDKDQVEEWTVEAQVCYNDVLL